MDTLPGVCFAGDGHRQGFVDSRFIASVMTVMQGPSNLINFPKTVLYWNKEK
jgi:hypothetical protein